MRRFCYKNRVPAICTMRGTESRSGTLSSHLESEAHKESVKASRLKLPSIAEKIEAVPLYQVSNTQQKRFADRIGRVIAQVRSGVKNLSVSAFSWPSGVAVSQIADRFDFNAPFQPYEALQFDLQYIHQKVTWSCCLG